MSAPPYVLMTSTRRRKPATAIANWDDSGLVRKRDVLTGFLSVSRATLDRWIGSGYFPAGEVIGRRIRVWQVAEVKAWLGAVHPKAGRKK